MHPPPFHPDHLLSDWPDCRLELRCQDCRHVVYVPVRLLRQEHGDRTFLSLLKALRCGKCGKPPAPVFLLAGEHREFCYGAPPGWAIELVKKPT